jgi:hypothetical protein
MRNVSEKFVEEVKTQVSCSAPFFSGIMPFMKCGKIW